MRKLLGRIIDFPYSETVRSWSIGMLVVLCLISSCAMRRSITSLFSTESQASLVTNKATKGNLLIKDGFEYSSTDCKVTGQGLDDQQVSLKQLSSPIAWLAIFFFVLPEFLVSLFPGLKTPTVIQTPSSWLRWSYLPLFLQNRLLLI